jgi:hypothetical protein
LLARMLHHWSLSRIRVVSFSLLVSGEVLCGQTCLNAIGGQACPNDLPRDVRGTGGRAPLRMLQNDADSMALSLLEIDIGKAEEKVTSTRFWRRLIPQVHLSASFGIRDLVFVDPASFIPYLIPHDSYRLTISLSLNELFFSSQHTLSGRTNWPSLVRHLTDNSATSPRNSNSSRRSSCLSRISCGSTSSVFPRGRSNSTL